MPTYEYRCTACAHEFELLQSIKDEPRASCPLCARDARRLISGGGGLLFRGDGFYITDYRSESYQEAARKERPKAKKDGADSKAKTGAKKGTKKTSTDAGAGKAVRREKSSGDA